MKSFARGARSVPQVAVGSAAVLAIGSILALGATLHFQLAVARAGEVEVNHDGNVAGVIQEGAAAEFSMDGAADGGGGSGVRCCVGTGGFCVVTTGSCPSGTTAASCPCAPPV
jgi:hypothetical protein